MALTGAEPCYPPSKPLLALLPTGTMPPAPKKSVRAVARTPQQALWCVCGAAKLAAHGLCARCYARRQRDRAYFAGLRETVLARDHHCCQVCHRPEAPLDPSQRPLGGPSFLVVHHRRPGISRERLLISLCPACHARVHRLAAVLRPLPALLLTLWREQHPRGVEQLLLDFRPRRTQLGLPE
jgi:hypothetical protein